MMLSSGIFKVKYLVLLTNLATTTTLIAVENKIPNVTDLIKKNRLWCKDIRNWEQIFYYKYFKYFAILDANIIKN